MNELPIRIEKAELSRTGLKLSDGLGITEWAEIGKQLCLVNESLAWCIGDWINYGEKAYGEKYSEALAFFGREVLGAMGYELQTLKVFAHVCRSVERLIRINVLSFNHHRIVAPLTPKEQAYWLDLAKVQGWSVSQLRATIRDAKGEYQDEPQKVSFNTLNWVQDGLRYFRSQLENIGEWDNQRLSLIHKDIQLLKPVEQALEAEMSKRGMLEA